MEKVVDELSEFYKEYEKTQKRLKLFVEFSFNDIDSDITNTLELSEPIKKKSVVPNIVVHDFNKQTSKKGLF